MQLKSIRLSFMFKIPFPPQVPNQGKEESTPGSTQGIIYALVPAMLMSVIFFGIDSCRILAIAVISCISLDMVFQKLLLKTAPSVQNGSSALTGILLACCLPIGVPYWLVLLGSLFSTGVAKLISTVIGYPIFNPALAGRVLLLLLFPVQMTTWKGNVLMADTFTGATPLGLLGEGVKNGKSLLLLTGNYQLPGYFDLFWGNVAGSLGEISALALLIGGGYLLWKKIITWHIPVAIFATVLLLQGFLWIIAPSRFADPLFHLLSGGMMLGAIFMATDPSARPVKPSGQIVFGFGIAFITLMIRNFGPYPEGIAIAILVMNGFTPLINKRIKSIQLGKFSFH